MRIQIPLNKPYMTGREVEYIRQAHANGHLSGNGPFTQKCEAWLESQIGCRKALLTHSCTAALEMAAILLDIAASDEIILPSFTFVSTANAFALRGGKPVFVDIRRDTLNIDEKRVEQAITKKTRAIVAVHYSGVACEMAALGTIAKKHGLFLIEDAAQAVLSTYHGRPLGHFGELAAMSFHETKALVSGEGGALFVNDRSLIRRAEILREKGTNRSRFFRGEVDKYTWLDIGSSYLPSDLIAAFLWAQLGDAKKIVKRRIAIWNRYHEAFESIERRGLARRPIIPKGLEHNGFCYFLLLPDSKARTRFIEKMRRDGILTPFHYVPLHSSPAGKRWGRVSGAMTATNELSERIVRLPLWLGMEKKLDWIVDRVTRAVQEVSGRVRRPK